MTMATQSESCNYQMIDNYVVAIAVSGARSRRAVGWAAENLIPHASRVLLLHVLPPLSVIPSSLATGQKTPVEDVSQDSSSTYSDERINQVKKSLESFKDLCETGREVEIVVLVGEDPAVEILSYVSCSVIKNLVLGASTFTWFTRTVKGMDVPSTVLKSAPEICNVFLVSRWKLVFRLATKAFHFDSDPATQIRKTKLKVFTQKERSFVFNEQITSTDASSGRPASVISNFSRMNSGTSTESQDVLERNLSQLSIIGEDHQVEGFHNLQENWIDARLYRSQSAASDVNSDRMSEPPTPPEVMKLRLKEELERTLRKYNSACKDLIIAKKKIDTLTAQRSEEARKLDIARERERRVRMIAEEEKAKHAAVIRDIEKAKQELANVTMDKHKAQIRVLFESSKKARILDSLFSSDRRCKRYSEEDIIAATDNFSDSNKIGEGGYGNVYKCNLDHTPVAIKVLNTDGYGNRDQFLREVEVLTRLNHPHIVLLLGACPEIQCLVYEYMAGGSLEDRLFCKDGSQPLPWEARFRIVLEVAFGLAFLHGSKPDPIVHCDVKPGNILLDRNYSSKIGDVGMSRFMADVVPDSISEFKDTQICGTMHYLDPEYQRTGTLRPKSDLYAFGITILQVLTAKKPFGVLVTVEDAIQNGTFCEILDPSVKDWPVEESKKLAELALKCSSLKCKDRPDLEPQVIPELEQLVKPLCRGTTTGIKFNTPQISAPTYYLCPILQEVMEDPYIAADGFTYERRAIQAWLARYSVSPVTKLALDHTDAIPNRTLRASILEWKSLVENY